MCRVSAHVKILFQRLSLNVVTIQRKTKMIITNDSEINSNYSHYSSGPYSGFFSMI